MLILQRQARDKHRENSLKRPFSCQLIGSIAPRPALLYTPKGNRFAQPVAVAKAAQAASERWGSNSSSPSSHKKKNFVVIAPNASSDFASAEISAALSWTKEFVVGSGGS